MGPTGLLIKLWIWWCHKSRSVTANKKNVTLKATIILTNVLNQFNMISIVLAFGHN